jgi:hypothetical protein
VFLGTTPLLGSIVWGLLSSERRLTRIGTKLDGIETKIDKVRDDLADVRERLGKVEGRLEGPHIVPALR